MSQDTDVQAQHRPSFLANRTLFGRVRACALCLGTALVVVEGLAQEGEQGVAWISGEQHQRVILPRLSGKTAAQSNPTARGVSEPVPVVSTLSASSNDPAEVVVAEQLLRKPARAVRAQGQGRKMNSEIAQMLQRASRHFSVDAHLVQAVIHAESAFNPRAVSPKNAIGLMQVLPSTARDLGLLDLQGLSVEQLLADPRVSIVLGTKYLAEQLARFGGDVELAVAAYNAGPGAVIKAGHRVPNYPETRHYVRRVLNLTQSYRSQGSRQDSLGAPK